MARMKPSSALGAYRWKPLLYVGMKVSTTAHFLQVSIEGTFFQEIMFCSVFSPLKHHYWVVRVPAKVVMDFFKIFERDAQWELWNCCWMVGDVEGLDIQAVLCESSGRSLDREVKSIVWMVWGLYNVCYCELQKASELLLHPSSYCSTTATVSADNLLSTLRGRNVEILQLPMWYIEKKYEKRITIYIKN